MKEVKKTKQDDNFKNNIIKIIVKALQRNFGGLPDFSIKSFVSDIFKKKMPNLSNSLQLITENMQDYGVF